MGEDTHWGGQVSAGQDTNGTPGPAMPYGRRALMIGAAAAGAGITVGLVGGASRAQAADQQNPPVLLGTLNEATTGTTIQSTGYGFAAETSAAGLTGVGGGDTSLGGGFGVFGTSRNGTGVHGDTGGDGKAAVEGKDTSSGGGTGVYATSAAGTGVYGQTGGDGQAAVKAVDESAAGGYGVYATSPAGTGVFGETAGDRQLGVYGADSSPGGGTGVFGNSEHGTGVFGESGHGTGVLGQTAGNGKAAVQGQDASTGGATGVRGISVTGTGVSAVSTAGAALDVAGVARFSRSGTATVAGTRTRASTSVKVTGVTLTAGSMILATPQAHHVGVGVAAAVPDVAARSFTIYLTAPVKAAVKVAWFIIG